MVKVLIVYDSRTGNTEKMAGEVAEGARTVEGVDVSVAGIERTRLEDLLQADAIILGSPTYYGNMSGKMKELIDKSFNVHGKLEGKLGGSPSN